MSLPTTLIHTISAKTNDTTKLNPVITTPDLNNSKEKTQISLSSPATDLTADNYTLKNKNFLIQGKD